MVDVKKVKLAKKGNAQAFQELIEQEKVKLYKMAYIYMKNEHDALEVFQETVYKTLVSIKSLKEEKYFSTWVTKILINTAIEFLRKQKKIVPMEKEVLDRNIQPFQTAVVEQIDLLASIKGLEEKYKSVLLLRFYKDYSIKQIAELLDCPEGTVKTNIHRGIILLREKIKEGCVNE
ncbi:sigma-70 family RNA polymerase sigma factor [Cytobacillus sp. FJAT-54145]|uniref:Sigma-70 family RNA polymerase sigma factor n=1 Tax=Cytobacillus spartinae TaxID=3299023 RepID=A0ABW6KFI9_9BACI